mgnify:CR=1 FL=1
MQNIRFSGKVKDLRKFLEKMEEKYGRNKNI